MTRPRTQSMPLNPVMPAGKGSGWDSPFVDVLFKILAALSIPLILWGLSLYKQMSLQELRNSEYDIRHQRIEQEIKQLNFSAQEVKLSVVRMEVKLDAIHEKIQEIRSNIIRGNRDSVGATDK